MTRRAVSTAVLVLLVASLAGGCSRRTDQPTLMVHRLVTITTTDAVELPGQKLAAKTDTVTLWLGPGLARRDEGRATFLVDGGRKLLAQLDHEQRTWVRASTEQVSRGLAALSRDTVRAGNRRTHMLKSLLNVAARVTDTGETATIGDYPCRRWIVEQNFGEQNTTGEVWLTDAIDVDSTLLQRINQPALAAIPGGEQALVELSKLRGVPVRAAALHEIMGRETRSESRLVSVEVVEVPRSFFVPPADYRPVGRESQ